MGTEYLDTTGTQVFGRIGPLTTVVPFSYRDGTTFQKLLYSLRDYMTNVLHPHFDGEIERIIGEFNIAIDNVENKTAGLEDVIREFFEKIESYVNESVDPIAAAAVKKHLDDFVKDPGTLDLFNRVFASRITEDTARKQSALYGEFFTKLRNRQPVTICTMGDSTTYGYDMVSGDRQPAPKDVLPDGSIHYRDRSPRPYPLVMETRLKEVYGDENITVINRGYSGDTTRSAFPRWITPSGAGITVISFGINDSIQGSIDTFLTNYEKIILREINEYNAAVVILTPFKQGSHTPSRHIDAFRSSLYSMASKYGVPVIDAEPWLSGYSMSHFSDNTHMNTKGYEVIGTRAAALFVGAGPMEIQSVSHGSRLGIRPTIDNIFYGDGSGISNSGAEVSIGTPAEGNLKTGGMFAYLVNSSVYYSFYAETPDLMIALNYAGFPETQASMSLDFGIEQPDNLSDEFLDLTQSFSNQPESTVTFPASGSGYIFNGVRNERYKKMLRVSSTGWHTLRVKSTGTGSGTRLLGVEFLSQRTFAPPLTRYPLTLTSAVTGIYNQNYYKNGGEVCLEGGVAIPNIVAAQFYKVATLPEGYRPMNIVYAAAPLSTAAATVSGLVRVLTNGDIEISSPQVTAAALMLNGIRFVPA